MALRRLLHVGGLQGTVVGTVGGDSQSPYHGILSFDFEVFLELYFRICSSFLLWTPLVEVHFGNPQLYH